MVREGVVTFFGCTDISHENVVPFSPSQNIPWKSRSLVAAWAFFAEKRDHMVTEALFQENIVTFSLPGSVTDHLVILSPQRLYSRNHPSRYYSR